MKANIGSADKVIRILLGVALLLYAALGQGALRWWGLIGVVPLLTGLVNFCPLYALLGIRSCPLETKY